MQVQSPSHINLRQTGIRMFVGIVLSVLLNRLGISYFYHSLVVVWRTFIGRLTCSVAVHTASGHDYINAITPCRFSVPGCH
jgi:hypothetical protein